jgi:hypothetical protein
VSEQSGFHMSIPAVSIQPVYSREDRNRYFVRSTQSLPNATSFRVPVFHLSF